MTIIGNDILWSLLSGVIALIGDILEDKCENYIRRALVDNITHFLVAACTWTSVSCSRSALISRRVVQEIVLCGIIASMIDIDHFLAAASINLKDAIALRSRPPFHNTTLLILTGAIIIYSSVSLHNSWLWSFGWLFLAASLSHHLRDASRRGFWLWPFGSTKPLSRYIIVQSIFPLIIAYFHNLMKFPEASKFIMDV